MEKLYSKPIILKCRIYLCGGSKPTIPAFGRLRQEDYEFKASLVYTARPCFRRLKRVKLCYVVEYVSQFLIKTFAFYLARNDQEDLKNVPIKLRKAIEETFTFQMDTQAFISHGQTRGALKGGSVLKKGHMALLLEVRSHHTVGSYRTANVQA